MSQSKNVFVIKKSRNNNFSDFNETYSSSNLEEVQAINPSLKSKNGGSGGTINWNSSNESLGGIDVKGKTFRPTKIVLGHEIFHARDSNRGKLYPTKNYTNPLYKTKYEAKYKGLLKAEWRAVYYENILRGDLEVPLRAYYGVQTLNMGKFGPVEGEPRLLDSENKPLNYNDK